MKKIIASVFAAAMLLMGTEAFAQLVPGAGYLLSIEKSKSENSALDAIKLNGFYVGASYNIPLVGGLGVAPGLYADMLFYNGAATVREIVTFTEHYTELALNLPVNLNYQFEISDNASPALRQIRRGIHQAAERVRSELTRIVSSSSNYLQDSIITMRDGRYCIPVKSEF